MTRAYPSKLAPLLALVVLLPIPATAALRTVVAEEFTGTWCGWCPSAMEGLYNLEQQVGERLAVVAYHVSDAFQVPGCVDRKNYYTVTGYPTVMLDGLIRVLGGDTIPVDYTPFYNQRQGIPSPVFMDLTLLSYDGATGQGTVRADIYSEPERDDITATLRYVATGDDTLYNWQGFNHLYFTALHVFPSAAGVGITVPSGGMVSDVQSFQIPAGWRDRACTIVAFLQDDTTKEILQGGNLAQVTPVELVGFAAHTTRDGVLLSWTTASETDNAGFRIYRTVDGRREVLTPGMVPGAGTTAVPQAYEYVDGDIDAGTTYLYTLSDVSLSGIERFHAPVRVSVPRAWGAPTALRLEPAQPCPAAGDVTFRYSLPEDAPASLAIYDVSGRHVRTLRTTAEAGFHAAVWDLADGANHRVGPGLYIARLSASGGESAVKVVVTR
ncbi:T9SS type A sorting domain-containing protein [Candidatus Fermentibacteria bacterium]|nr:T9SS type A sorting domain-containing protein [Candidatus Fermentibacteria bacterium]